MIVPILVILLYIKGHVYSEESLNISDSENLYQPNSISEFPRDIFADSEYPYLISLVHLSVSIYIFIAISILCEKYFVPSLECLRIRLGINTDIAGATLMAIGGSMPELWVSLVGVFVTKGDIGTGTILGSSVLNVLLVVGLCGLVSYKMDLKLDWWPITRDSSMYLTSLVMLFLILLDDYIEWYEAMLLMFYYNIYIYLIYHDRVLRLVFKVDNTDSDLENAAFLFDSESEDVSRILKKETCPACCWHALIKGVLMPIHAVFAITMPFSFDFHSVLNEKQYRKMILLCLACFIVSTIWIGALTYVLIWMMVIIANNYGIPESIIGITFVALGSSIPDAYSSLIVVKKGYGNMAICHSIGSNIFDLLIGLGLPWIMAILYRYFAYGIQIDNRIKIYSTSMLYSCAICIISIIIMWLMIYAYKWRLKISNSALLISFYAFFIASTICLELYQFKNGNIF